MRKKSLVGTLVAICVVAACGDAPTGVEPFEPQFDHVLGAGGLYDFDDLLTCSTGALASPYHGLVFVGAGSVASCLVGAPSPFAGSALVVLGTSGLFSLDFTAIPASDVSIQAVGLFGGGGSAALVAYSGDDVCDPGPLGLVVGPSVVVTLSVSCDLPITKVEFLVTPVFVGLDNLTVTFGSGGLTATAELKPVGKSIKHNKGKFEVVATCTDESGVLLDPTSVTLTIGADDPPVDVEHGDRLDLRIKSGKAGRSGKGKSNKSGKSKKRFVGDSFTLTVTCDGGLEAMATAEFPDKPKSGKSKGKKSKSKSK